MYTPTDAAYTKYPIPCMENWHSARYFFVLEFRMFAMAFTSARFLGRLKRLELVRHGSETQGDFPPLS